MSKLLLLSLLIQYFVYGRLKSSGVHKSIIIAFVCWGVFWCITGHIARYDFNSPFVEIFPGRWAEILRSFAMTWAVITILLFFSFIAVDILAWLTGFKVRKILCSVILALAGTVYCFFEAYFVTSRHIVIPTSKLPEGTDRIRIAFVSDIHTGGLSTYAHLKRIVNLVNESEPDMLLLGGDIFDGKILPYRERELALLKDMAGKMRYGAFAVNGNHEYYRLFDEDVEQIIRDCGYKLLIFERAEAAGIVIIGLDDAFYGWLSPYLKPDDKNKFVLVLKHRPGLPFDSEGKFDLMLSGHTHGGQFWPLGYFKSKSQHSTQGLSRKSGGYVYVSNGAGFNGTPMRLFAPPEITIIDIVRES